MGAQQSQADRHYRNALSLPPNTIARNYDRDPRLFGRAGVPTTLLRQKLGTAWRTYWHMVETAGLGGEGLYFEHPERACAELKITHRKLRHDAVKIAAAGLLRLVSRVKIRGRWHTTRFVAGHYAVDMQGRVLLVPDETFKWVNRPERRGGKRAGAGRPTLLRKQSNMGQLADPKQSNPGRLDSKHGQQITTRRSSTRLIEPKGSMGPADAVPFETLSSSKAPTAPVPANTPANPVKETTSPRTGIRIGGGGPPRRPPPGPGEMGVPRYPGPAVAVPARVPPPPRLPEGLPDKDAVEWLLRAYRGAYTSRTKKKCWVNLGKNPAKSKNWKPMLEAAQLLRDHEIAPAAWCLWSMELWAKYGKAGTTPPLLWVFGKGRINEREGWFKHEAEHYTESRLVFSPFAQELLRRYAFMQRELILSGAQDEAAVAVVVQRWFPGKLYDELSECAKARAQDDQARMTAAVRRGDWIW